ncbi:MAG: HAMP domain-containing protein [Planctomycetes bacterium]|nr:HAMP domain-containing protein [Planctomycetota bacterium]
MRLGMRGKLALLFGLVGLAPLLLGTIILVTGMQRIRLQAFGQKLEATAQAESARMLVSKRQDIETLLLAFNEQWVVASVEDMTRDAAASEIRAIEQQWDQLSPEEEPVQGILSNSLAGLLRQFMAIDKRFVELLITDRHGNLIAATNKTEDYFQADEQWWTRTYASGGGAVYLGSIHRDISADAWSIEICVPIRHDLEVVGIVKVVTDVGEWLGGKSRDIGEFNAGTLLLDDDGLILYGDSLEPFSRRLENWNAGKWNGRSWRVHDGVIQAYSRILLPSEVAGLPVDAPVWNVVLHVPLAEPMAAVHVLTLRVLAVALITIILLFLAGAWISNRSIVARVRKLNEAARRVAEGDLTHRVRPRGGVFRRDELDDLAHDFDRMVDQIQQTHEALVGADEVKSQFIKVASHELRTPVSYILGMARLLKENKDPERLLQALQSIAGKAKRLDEIIHAMFKLLPEQKYVQQVDYEKVVISELMEEVYLDTFPFVERRNQRMVMELAPGLPEIEADRDKLRDAIENLVTNAIKFTPDGGMIKIGAMAQLDGFISISVTDQGPGIPRPELARIFEPFYTGGDVLQHSSGAADYQKRGMGLGLAVVRSFVQMHGGTVNVNSSPTGSTFTIAIPVKRPEEARRRSQ